MEDKEEMFLEDTEHNKESNVYCKIIQDRNTGKLYIGESNRDIYEPIKIKDGKITTDLRSLGYTLNPKTGLPVHYKTPQGIEADENCVKKLELLQGETHIGNVGFLYNFKMTLTDVSEKELQADPNVLVQQLYNSSFNKNNNRV